MNLLAVNAVAPFTVNTNVESGVGLMLPKTFYPLQTDLVEFGKRKPGRGRKQLRPLRRRLGRVHSKKSKVIARIISFRRRAKAKWDFWCVRLQVRCPIMAEAIRSIPEALS